MNTWQSLLVLRVEDSKDLSISLVYVQPLPTAEDGGDTDGCVGDFHAIQQPTGTEARVVVLYPNFLQLSNVQHLQVETVGLLTFEKVAKLLPQGLASSISVRAVDSDENVGICTCALLISGYDDDLILDGHQALSFTGEALDGLCALKVPEIIPLCREGDVCVATEKVPGVDEADKNDFINKWRLILFNLIYGSVHTAHHWAVKRCLTCYQAPFPLRQPLSRARTPHPSLSFHP